MTDDPYKSLKETLDTCETWPCSYVFKFIAPLGKLDELLARLDGMEHTTRPSSKGNYVSVTVRARMESSDEVIRVYEKVSDIEGVLSL